jgi:hypothetical protein
LQSATTFLGLKKFSIAVDHGAAMRDCRPSSHPNPFACPNTTSRTLARGEWINGAVAVDLHITADYDGIPRIVSLKQKTLRKEKGTMQPR